MSTQPAPAKRSAIDSPPRRRRFPLPDGFPGSWERMAASIVVWIESIRLPAETGDGFTIPGCYAIGLAKLVNEVVHAMHYDGPELSAELREGITVLAEVIHKPRNYQAELFRLLYANDPGTICAPPAQMTLQSRLGAGVDHDAAFVARIYGALRRIAGRELQSPAPVGSTGNDERDNPKKQKRSTSRGDAVAKLISTLTAHHKYNNGSCPQLEPIGNNEIARRADVASASASEFFKKQFGGYAKYEASCRDAPRLAASLKLLNDEYTPAVFCGARTPDEIKQQQSDDDD